MPKKVYRPHASESLSYGYKFAEYQIGRRAERVYAWSQKEYKHLRKLAIYCHMMSVCKFTDAPDAERSSYFVDDMDEVPEGKLSDAMGEAQKPTWSDDREFALVAGLALLSPRERQAMKLHEGQGLSIEETAERMKVKVEAVYSYLKRAKSKWADIERRKDDWLSD